MAQEFIRISCQTLDPKLVSQEFFLPFFGRSTKTSPMWYAHFLNWTSIDYEVCIMHIPESTVEFLTHCFSILAIS